MRVPATKRGTTSSVIPRVVKGTTVGCRYGEKAFLFRPARSFQLRCMVAGEWPHFSAGAPAARVGRSGCHEARDGWRPSLAHKDYSRQKHLVVRSSAAPLVELPVFPGNNGMQAVLAHTQGPGN